MIVDQKVKMVWNSTVKNYYTALGYEWTKQGQEFEVDVKHLQLYSNKKVKFVCDICDGENQIEDKYRWKTMANLQKERERNGSDCCFICAHERTKNTNIKNAVKLGGSISEKLPEIAKEWSPKNKLTPNDYSYGSKQKVWWVCKKGHEWKTAIYNRATGYGCPYCTSQKVEDKISLYNLFPEIAKEWHPYRNRALSSKDVTAGSNRKVWWKCSECSYEWETTPNKRTGKGNTACPQCKFSKGEKKIASHLLHMKINYKPQYTFNDLTGLGNGLLKFDFAILTENKDELLFLIEYDGEFHYRKFYEEQNYETLLTHDNLKNEYCKNNNIRLLRIPYWDFDNIETLINEFYKNIISTTKQDLMHMS